MEAIEVPPRSLLLGEPRGLLEFPRLFLRSPRLARQPRGRGEPVMVLPGFGAGDASTAVLRGYLSFLGYRTRGWGMGTNGGDVPDLLERVVARVRRVAEREGRPVRVVGWSLGGYLAKEASRDAPEAVERVVTLGTPVVGGPKYTAAAGRFRSRGVDLDEIEAEVDARNRTPLERPVTAIYSRNDGVVAWRACIDPHAPDVEYVEVETTHVGLGFSPEVYEIVAQRMARSSGEAR